MIDVERARRDTPGCEKYIHFNNAGASLMPLGVTETMKEYIDLESMTGGYETADLRQQQIATFYQYIAELLKTEPQNIAYTTSATDAYGRALSSIPLEKDDVILTTSNDYISNQIAFLSLQKRFGIRVAYAHNLSEGGVDPDSVEEMIVAYRPKLVSVSHVPTNSGLIQDVVNVGKICSKYQTLYLVDACQSAGQIPLNVGEVHCDFLSATMRKYLRGPRGAGFLYVSDRALGIGLEPLLIDMRGGRWMQPESYEPRDDARRFEDWEANYALVCGAAEAVRYALDNGIQNIRNRIFPMAELLRGRLAKIPGVHVLDQGIRKCGIVTVYIEEADPDQLISRLRNAGIHAGISYREVAVMDFDRKEVPWALRLSPHYYNTDQELETVVEMLADFQA